MWFNITTTSTMKRKGNNSKNDTQTSPPGSPPPQRAQSSPPTPRASKAGKLREHFVFHEVNRASLLSTEAPAQNYRGLINLIMLVLVTIFMLLTVDSNRFAYWHFIFAVCYSHQNDHGEYDEIWHTNKFNKYIYWMVVNNTYFIQYVFFFLPFEFLRYYILITFIFCKLIISQRL